ncbi:3-hydroxyacyl-CoA dehydrogenase type-2-like [Saccostrea echinata]|uniref:3-hydroxyacyl-CoA dehydrogenase type-2-like n=1 Tax=Saccostrea echinata TaxID=191078 RepID=UPI002A7F5511|nr:3-hydroxyacyl-CoA dehydrogenase type-2-like [Saccostrea echinata]
MSKFTSLKGLVSLVTGGASGLGRATVERFTKQGARVILCDLPSSDGEQVAKSLENCTFFPADITSEAEVKEVLKSTMTDYKKLDILVNCAGIGVARKTYNIHKNKPHPLDEFERVLKVNTLGTFNVIRQAVVLMAQNEPNEDQARGVIVNTSSVAAFDGQMGQVAYSASKAAIAGMTLPLARDLGEYGIRVCTICPGVFDTPLLAALPQKAIDALTSTVVFPKRLGNPDEFAQMCQTIVENPYLNGETIRLDGALRMI